METPAGIVRSGFHNEQIEGDGGKSEGERHRIRRDDREKSRYGETFRHQTVGPNLIANGAILVTEVLPLIA